MHHGGAGRLGAQGLLALHRLQLQFARRVSRHGTGRSWGWKPLRSRLRLSPARSGRGSGVEPSALPALITVAFAGTLSMSTWAGPLRNSRNPASATAASRPPDGPQPGAGALAPAGAARVVAGATSGGAGGAGRGRSAARPAAACARCGPGPWRCPAVRARRPSSWDGGPAGSWPAPCGRSAASPRAAGPPPAARTGTGGSLTIL